MGRRDKLRRHWRERLRPLSASAAQPTPSPIQSLFPVMRFVDVDNTDSPKPYAVYVSLSPDLRVIPLKPTASTTSVLDFRKPHFHIALHRISKAQPDIPLTPAATLAAAVEPRVSAEAHDAGPAVRVSDGTRTVLLIADTDDERDAFLSALRLRVAPWPLLLAHMKGEVAAARAAALASPSLTDAARQFFAGEASEVGATEEERRARVARRVWEKAGTVAETYVWIATFVQQVDLAAQPADEVHRLTKPLAGLAVVGCVFSLVALAAKAANLMALDKKGKYKLVRPKEDLREASVLLVGWLFTALGSGFQDEDGLVERVFGVLEDCWMMAKELEEYLLRKYWVAWAWAPEEIDFIVNKVVSLKEKLLGVGLLKSASGVYGHQLREHERRLGDLEIPVVDHFCLPSRTQTEDVMDMGMGMGMGLVADAATCLGTLKAAVLEPKSDTLEPAAMNAGNFSGRPRSRQRPCVSRTVISGEGGVGKSSTCMLLCEDAGVRKHFSGGAFVWIDVGKSASEEKVKTEIRRAVSRFGGERSAEKVLSASDVVEAVESAREFFADMCILVVIDNVCETPAGSKAKSWTGALAKIASHSGSAVIATTRSRLLAASSGFNELNLGRLDLSSESSSDWRVAEDIYDLLLKASGDTCSTAVYKRNRKKALALSCGLLLGIKTVACAARSCNEFGEDAEDMLLKIEKRCMQSIAFGDTSVGDDAKATIAHPELFAAMNESLCFLDERKSCDVKSKPLMLLLDDSESSCRLLSSSYAHFSALAFSSRYAALHMLQSSSPAISFSLLRQLWHVATIEEAKFIGRRFEDFGLGRIVGADDDCFVLHDLQYEYCSLSRGLLSPGALAGRVSEGCDPLNGHALFLSSCKSLLLSTYGVADFTQWAHFCFGDSASSDSALGDYLQNNLLRHLCCLSRDHDAANPAKFSVSVEALKREILSVLCNFRWLNGRQSSGRTALSRDLHYAFESRVLSDSDTYFLQKLRKTLMQLRNDGVVQSDGTLATSLIQLIQSSKTENSGFAFGLFEQLVENAEEEVPGVWLKPVGGCCRSFEPGVLRKAFVSSSRVAFVSSLGDGTHFVSLSDDGTVRIHDFANLDTALVLGGLGEIQSIAIVPQRRAKGSSFVFSGDANGSVLCSEVTSDGAGALFKSCYFVGDTGSSIRCLSASKDGEIIAAGCGDGSVSVWKLDGGNHCSYLLENTFPCFEDETGEDWVKSVVVSGSGHFVAACSLRGYLAFWRGEKGSAERVAMARPAALTSEACNSENDSMFLARDETALVVLFNSPSAYEIWDVESGERRASRVELLGFRETWCANVPGASDGTEFERSLDILVGGYDPDADGHFVAAYSIGDEVEMIRRCRLSSAPISITSAEFSSGAKLSSAIVGCADGSVCLLGIEAFEASRILQRSESGMNGERGSLQTPLPELGEVSAVAVMLEADLVVAGHDDGRLSLWSAEDGSFNRVIDIERKFNTAVCIAISADESIAVTGHKSKTALVWDTATWTVRCALDGHSSYAACIAISTDASLVFIVDEIGELRVWDARRGGAAFFVIETGLEYDMWRTRAFLSPDGCHFMWAACGPRFGVDDQAWEAIVIDVGKGRIIFESAEYCKWDELCTDIDLGLPYTTAIGSWKEAAVQSSCMCDLSGFEEESGRCWEISRQPNTRVQCALRSAGGELSDKASIGFDSLVRSVAAQGLPEPGEDGRRRAVVACALYQKSVPVIMHFTTSKV